MEHDNAHKFEIFIQTSPTDQFPLGYGFIHEGLTRELKPLPQNDFYLPVFLMRTSKLEEFVNIDQDETIFPIKRQEVNPFFIEFSFFDTIKRNKVNEGNDLTNIMLNYIRSVRPDIANFIDQDIKKWFDYSGRYQFPWNKGESDETTLDDLDVISLISQNIISKANFFNIEINS